MLTAFLGYRKANFKIARRLVQAINQNGDFVLSTSPPDHERYVHLIFDAHLEPGVLWDTEIEQKILKSSVMFVLVTGDLLGDTTSYLRTREIPLAKENNIPIVPIVFEQVLSHLDLEDLAQRNAIPQGGTPSGHMSSERAWILAVAGAMNKRCKVILDQGKGDQSEALRRQLTALRGSAEEARAVAAKHATRLPPDDADAVERNIRAAIDATRLSGRNMVADLRIIADSVLWLRSRPGIVEEVNEALAAIVLAASDARIAAQQVEFPSSLPVTDTGKLPEVRRDRIVDETQRVEAAIDDLTTAITRAKAVLSNDPTEFREIGTFGVESVGFQNEMVRLAMGPAQVDAGLVASAAQGGKYEAERVYNSADKSGAAAEIRTAAYTLLENAQLVVSGAREISAVALKPPEKVEDFSVGGGVLPAQFLDFVEVDPVARHVLEGRALSDHEASSVRQLSLSPDHFPEAAMIQAIAKAFANIGILRPMKNLEKLNLANTSIDDLSAIASLQRLRELDLANTRVVDVSPLSELRDLETLILAGTSVSDIEPLAKLKKLRTLDLTSTKVKEVGALRHLKRLQMLDLGFTDVQDTSPVAHVPQLKKGRGVRL